MKILSNDVVMRAPKNMQRVHLEGRETRFPALFCHKITNRLYVPVHWDRHNRGTGHEETCLLMLCDGHGKPFKGRYGN